MTLPRSSATGVRARRQSGGDGFELIDRPRDPGFAPRETFGIENPIGRFAAARSGIVGVARGGIFGHVHPRAGLTSSSDARAQTSSREFWLAQAII